MLKKILVIQKIYREQNTVLCLLKIGNNLRRGRCSPKKNLPAWRHTAVVACCANGFAAAPTPTT